MLMNNMSVGEAFFIKPHLKVCSATTELSVLWCKGVLRRHWTMVMTKKDRPIAMTKPLQIMKKNVNTAHSSSSFFFTKAISKYYPRENAQAWCRGVAPKQGPSLTCLPHHPDTGGFIQYMSHTAIQYRVQCFFKTFPLTSNCSCSIFLILLL